MALPGTRTYAAWFVVCLLAPSSLRAQQNTMKVEFTDDPSRNTVVGVFRRENTVYVSLTDLVHVFSLSTYENRETRKLEVKRGALRMKVSGGNPFIIITDEPGRPTVFQLPQDVIFAAGSFFVPLGPFLQLFPAAFGAQAFFDSGSNLLHIGGQPSATLFDIRSITLLPKANGVLIRIASQKKLTDYENWLRPDGWLYVTIADARADTAGINATKPIHPVQEVIAIQSPTSLQLTFRIAGTMATSEIVPDEGTNDLLLLVRAAMPEEAAALAKGRSTKVELEGRRKRWQLDVIVLDAGHGGYDPGSIGVTGVKEKNVTLGIVSKLGRLITRNLKSVEVVYTRRDDRFVELDRRGSIANAAEGKLFISVHANAMPRKPSATRGFEVYLLRPGRTEEAIAIAERENSVIALEQGYEDRYQKLTEENFILVTMAQSAHVKASEVFADLAQKEMEERTGIPNRGVRQAGFYVLVGAAMPNVLVETAYLSNKADERFLASDSGQQKIAEALFRAIKKYKDAYEKLLMEG